MYLDILLWFGPRYREHLSVSALLDHPTVRTAMATGMDTLGLYDLTSTSSNEKTSLLYSVLPRLVRTRLRRLPSLRRSFSQYTLDSTASTPSHSRRSSRLYSDLETPPPGYQSQVSLSEPVSDEEGDVDLPLRPLSSSSSDEPAESGSGIVWRFADQGMDVEPTEISFQY